MGVGGRTLRPSRAGHQSLWLRPSSVAWSRVGPVVMGQVEVRLWGGEGRGEGRCELTPALRGVPPPQVTGYKPSILRRSVSGRESTACGGGSRGGGASRPRALRPGTRELEEVLRQQLVHRRAGDEGLGGGLSMVT